MLTNANVEIVRNVRIDQLIWPDRSTITEWIRAEWNHEYVNLGRISRRRVREVIAYERKLLERHATTPKVFDLCDADGEDAQMEKHELFHGLDDGVASCVFALWVRGCLTCSSCNGGVFGDGHNENHPLIVMFARPENIPLLLDCAQRSNIGLINHNNGSLMLYANDIRQLIAFSEELIS
jgi:hypothetical protein